MLYVNYISIKVNFKKSNLFQQLKKEKDNPFHRESLKMVQMNLFTKYKQSPMLKKKKKTLVMVISYWGERMGVDTGTLLYIKQITNKDLLYRTGNSTQYSAVAYVEPKKE